MGSDILGYSLVTSLVRNGVFFQTRGTIKFDSRITRTTTNSRARKKGWSKMNFWFKGKEELRGITRFHPMLCSLCHPEHLDAIPGETHYSGTVLRRFPIRSCL